MDNLVRYSLNELVDVRDGTHDSPKYVNDGFPLITSKNLVNGSVDFENVNFITETDFDSINKRSKVDEGDILYSMIGSIGNFAIVNFEPRFAIKNVALFKFKNSKLSSKYFIYYIKSNEFTTQIEKQSKGGTQKFVTLKILRNIQIPLPPLPQQQKIANILDAADALRQNDKALIAKYDELTQALFLDMFGDPVSNPKGWEFKVLNQLVSKLGDGLHGTPKYSEDGEYYFVNGNNLDNGKITISENTKRVDFREYEKHKKDLNENTMLVSINGTIGKIAFYNNEKIILGKSACYFNLIKGSVNDIFLFHIFKSDYFLRYSSSLSTGSTIQNVSLKTMREFPIPIPPLELQNQFAERVAVIEEQKAIAQKSLEKSESLFNSLLQKAFKGEL